MKKWLTEVTWVRLFLFTLASASSAFIAATTFGRSRHCCSNWLKTRLSPPQTNLSLGFRDRCAERGETVQDGNAHLELRDLTVEVPGGQALTQQLNAVHLGLCAASAMIPAPSSPDRATDARRCTQDALREPRQCRVYTVCRSCGAQ